MAVALSALPACGGGGGGSRSGAVPRSIGGGVLVPAALELVATDPPAGSVATSTSQTLRYGFDGTVRSESLDPARTTLTDVALGVLVSADLAVADGGHSVTIDPEQDLRPGAVYEVVLAGDLHSADGRFLENDRVLRFRTAATQGPSIRSVVPAALGAIAPGRPEVRVTLDGPVDPVSLTELPVEWVQGTLRIPGEAFLDRIAEADQLTDVLILRPTAPLSGAAPVELFVGGIRAASGAPGSPQTPLRWNVSPTSELRVISRVEPSGPLSPTGGLVLYVDTPIESGSIDASHFVLTMSGVPAGAVVVGRSDDGQRIYVQPVARLSPGASIRLTLQSGAFRYRGGQANSLWIHDALIGSDEQAPRIVSTDPSAAETTSPGDLTFRIALDEDVLAPSIDRCELQIDAGGGFASWPLDSVTLAESQRELLIEPAGLLPLDAGYRLSIASAPDAVRDLLGNPADDLVLHGRIADAEFPEFVAYPEGSLSDLPTTSAIILRAERRLDRASFAGAVTVVDDRQRTVTAQVTLAADDRTIRIAPVGAWSAAVSHDIRIESGTDGLRAADGTWLGQPVVIGFRAVPKLTQAPLMTLSVESLPDWQATEPRVPASGVRFEAGVDRGIGGSLDPTTVRLDLAQDGAVAHRLDVRDLVFMDEGLTLSLAEEIELSPGSWTATLHASNLNGVSSMPKTCSFRVVTASAGQVPLERVQIVAVLFELDRDGNGLPDFREDLVRLGLATGYASTGLDAEMELLLRDGILSRAHTLYRRTPDGARLEDGSSVPIRFVDGRPRGVAVMDIACGGLDPEGERGRVAGDPSSGTLGRAFFDARNSKPLEHATATRPGLGVFPGEVFLYESRIALMLGAGLRTGFHRTFAPLSPAFGGDPLGTDPDDTVVMSPDFDYESATSRQRARYQVVMGAADEWATVIGTILAHEVGHCIGLTEPGEHPVGLHGDETLHNADASPTDVMNATLGYDAMVRLDFSFRELNLAYLLHRVVIE